jgi:hypothetical protein
MKRKGSIEWLLPSRTNFELTLNMLRRKVDFYSVGEASGVILLHF